MPSIPSPELSLQDRLLELAKTLQFAWFAGHVTLLLSVSRYLLSWMRMNYYGGMAQFCYRTTFLSAAATYGIVVYKTFRAKNRSGQKMALNVNLLADENIQYLAMSLVWLIMPQYVFAMMPYTVYSIFHVATYSRSNLIPTISPKMVAPPAGTANARPVPAPNPISEKLGWFVKSYYDSAMSVVAALEIAIWARLLLSAIFFARRSWILMILYSAFLRVRYAQSAHVQNAFTQLDARVNTLLGSQNVPPAARQGWITAKTIACKARDATDVYNYLGGDSNKFANVPGSAKKSS